MKNLILSSAVILGAFAAPTYVMAQDDVIEDEVVTPKEPKDWFVYVDANIATTQFSSTDGDTTFVSDSASAAYFRGGFKYKFVGAEVELGTGLSDIEEDGITVGVGSQTSAFAILRTPGDKFDVFLRAGYHSTKIDVSGSVFDPQSGQFVSASEELDANGFAAGVGGSYFFTDNFGLRADITGYNVRDLVEASYVAASIGGSVRF